MPLPDFRSGPVAILGTGREARAAWRCLRTRYPDIALTLIDEAAPGPDLAQMLEPGDRVETARLEDAHLERFAVLVRSPGISIYREALKRARESGVRITTPSNLWFATHRDARTVCITGTKGKSTTAALLAHLLKVAGLSVRLAGNIGKPLLDCDDRGVDCWVIELSSYQLADLEARPSIAVLLNLTPEHLDWHGGEAAYRRDKMRLADLAGGHPVVANAADPVLRDVLGGRAGVHWFNDPDGYRAGAGRVWNAGEPLDLHPPDGLPGAHNLANIAAVLTVGRLLGVPAEFDAPTVAGFHPLPHRLQMLGERLGVRYINDSISSTPVATAAALEALSGRPLTLIVGGLDRGLDWTPYMRTFASLTPHAIVTVPDSGSRIAGTLRRSGIQPAAGLHEAESLADGVERARQVTPPGGVILLSPGAPSFPRFRDYRDRGRVFAELSGLPFEEVDPF